MSKHKHDHPHTHGRHHHPGNHEPVDFEEIYASGVQWSGNPNDTLVRVVSDLEPGAALDLGCGEGADVVWLARQGWEVVGVDPSTTAVERSARLVEHNGLGDSTELITGGIEAVADREFTLVSVFYVPFPGEDTVTVPRLEKLVAPGGHLLFVHHDFPDGRVLSPRAVAEQLSELEVISLETTERHVTGGAGAHHRVDVVLLARRPE
ncbi:class I SAM-dependent methyltransferase [Corynebacterium guangdongense]|uniref:SAM-dependent methyltransferase n=1 Tax=Corynebacterium guangdongense TaxID=1783348 RepID=A0ABU1ZWQ9_9CORY|nr:class I SAM-dependent methyltransferase [Corynebacterium guangdongense]MDR7329195.1 SAM-dependent methyltransferase [Corynebacterium guangdongense]WJZ17761.1 tellurite resistance protein TehB [Corynebacterium guangdongense]